MRVCLEISFAILALNMVRFYSKHCQCKKTVLGFIYKIRQGSPVSVVRVCLKSHRNK